MNSFDDKEIELYVPEEYKAKYKISSRDLKQYKTELNKIKLSLENTAGPDYDNDSIIKCLSELFWQAKEKNKLKYGRKNKNNQK